MGIVKTEKLANNNVGLEIIYGGLEAPFGGIDTSAPPAYIDPKCFTAADGFLVVDNKLVVCSLQPTSIPTLWSGTAGVILLSFGTFYNSIKGQLNYVLGYTATAFGVTGTSPTGVNYIFYMTSWPPGFIAAVSNDILEITLFDGASVEEQASINLDVISTYQSSAGAGTGATFSITSVSGTGAVTGVSVTSGGSGFGVGDIVQLIQGAGFGIYGAWVKVLTVSGSAIDTISIFNPWDDYAVGSAVSGNVEAVSGATLVINGPAGGPNTYTVESWSNGFTRQQLATSMVTAINSGSGDPNVIASTSIDGFSVILTAITAGTAGNIITVQDTSTAEDATKAPPYYFSCRTATNLQGGQIQQSAQAPRGFFLSAATTVVGGTLYIAGIGPMILKFSGPGLFTTSTLYNGVGVIKKFGGSLIGLRLQGQLGTFTQNDDMIFTWSAAEDLDEWSPLDNVGNVTGAGFEQIGDVADYLSSLIVTNGTSFILRSQGVSYATDTGNATLPFDINHLSLGDFGEGCQVSTLATQYDQTGVFVGNSDIFQISSSLTSIGQKIKAALFASLMETTLNEEGIFLSSSSTFVNIGGDSFPIVVFSIGFSDITNSELILFAYNPSNGTWMILTYPRTTPSGNTCQSVIVSTFAVYNAVSFLAQFNSFNITTSFQTKSIIGDLNAPVFYEIQEGLANVNSISNKASISFPVEEISFGRDVTIDALYIALVADVSENTAVNFYISGTLFASTVLTPAEFNSLTANPTEMQIFPGSTSTSGAFTVHAPQLRVDIPSLTDAGTAQIRFTKISMFGSFDPAQRPV